MMGRDSHKIAVVDGRSQVSGHAIKLQKWGLSAESPTKYTGVIASVHKVEKIKRFAAANHLKFFYDNEYGQRDSSYRDRYFSAHQGSKGEFRCVYCGRRFSKEKITIDHLYPVAKVSKNIRLQQRLRKRGVYSLNAVENLVAACQSCNRKKSDQIGIWVLRGKIGTCEGLWKIRMILRVIFWGFVIFLLVYAGLYYLAPDLFSSIIATAPVLSHLAESFF